MYCPHCGTKLADSNQKYCHNCGIEVQATSNINSYEPEIIQSKPEPKTYYAPVTPGQKQSQMGLPGKYSRLCLGLALTSVLIGIISLAVGYSFVRNYDWGYDPIVRILMPTVNLPIRIGGLIAGIFGKINGSKAEIFEPYNDSEKAGSTFATIGIIINSIGIFLALFGPFSIMGYV